MAVDQWHEDALLFLFLLTVWKVNEYYSLIQRQQELKLAADIESRLRTQHDSLNQSRNNNTRPRLLTRSERRFRERQLQKQSGLRSQQGSPPRPRKEKEAEPVRKDPAIKEISRMNNRHLRPPPQLRQPSHISRLLRLLFDKLCTYTAQVVFPFHVFFVFCHHLRLCLRDSYLQDFKIEEDPDSNSDSDSEWETDSDSDLEIE